MTTLARTPSERGEDLREALRLEYLTFAWNIAEGAVALAAALPARSIALLGFGLDSFVESASAAVIIWRLIAERRDRRRDVAALDRQAHRLVAASLFLLAAYIVVDGARTLWLGERPDSSTVGMVLTVVSIGAMWWLARSKRRVAARMGSRAMAADAFQTTACWWLSLAALGGMGLNAALGWWWADPVAAMAMAVLLVREGRQAWRGDDCCG